MVTFTKREKELVALYDRYLEAANSALDKLAEGKPPSPGTIGVLKELREFLQRNEVTLAFTERKLSGGPRGKVLERSAVKKKDSFPFGRAESR